MLLFFKPMIEILSTHNNRDIFSMSLCSYSQLQTILYPTRSTGKVPAKVSFSYEEQQGRNSQGDSTMQTETSANPRGPLGRYKNQAKG